MPARELTRAEKRAAALEEARMRRNVYQRWIAAGRIAAADAEHRIRVMEAIAADYADPPLPDLFEDADG